MDYGIRPKPDKRKTVQWVSSTVAAGANAFVNLAVEWRTAFGFVYQLFDALS